MADKKNKNRRLTYLKDLSGYKMEKDNPDVRGWGVHDANNEKVGTISGLLTDPVSERIVYLDVDLDDRLISEHHDPFDAKHEQGIHEYQDKKGDIHMIIPVGVAHVDRDQKRVIADGINQGSLKNFPSYRYRKEEPIHPDYERRVMNECRKQRKYESREQATAERDASRPDRNLTSSEHERSDRDVTRSDRDVTSSDRDVTSSDRESSDRERSDRDITRSDRDVTKSDTSRSDRDVSDDDYYRSDYFDQDRFYRSSSR